MYMYMYMYMYVCMYVCVQYLILNGWPNKLHARNRRTKRTNIRTFPSCATNHPKPKLKPLFLNMIYMNPYLSFPSRSTN